MSKRYRGSKKGKNNKKQKNHGANPTIKELSAWVQTNRNSHKRHNDEQYKKDQTKRVLYVCKDISPIAEEIFGARYYCIGDQKVNGIIHTD